MTTERRHAPAVHEEQETFWESLPHDVLYPLLGFVLGLGSPVGAFALRYWQASPLLKRLWMVSELNYNSVFYVYMGVGTVTSFMIFGYFLGARSESQRVHNKNLKSRVDDLQIKSITDGLTGVYSHAYLQENLTIEIDRSRRHKRPLSVLIMDLDDFKKVNDTHGHLFGDRVLKEVTETIAMNVRQEDVFGRYGGEEFLVIMPGADSATAQRVAERVRRSVARTGIIDRRVAFETEAAPVHMTISIGLATLVEDAGEDGPALIKRADSCLYRAKRQGKNQVCS